MIKQLKIRNYQSHKDAELNLRPGVNLIVGDSDCGKSAVLRALRWLVFNRPSGFPFQSHWAKKGGDTAVEVALSDGNVARRVRNNKDNQYRLSTLEEPLEAVRTDVPEEVKAVLRMDALNVQRQGDKPFLLDESPPEVARVLNTVAGLDNIDTAHSRVAGKIRENQADQRSNETQLSRVNAALAVYRVLPGLQARADTVVRSQQALKGAKEQAAALSTAVERVEALTKRLQATVGVDKAATRLTKTEQAAADCVTKREACSRLGGMVQTVEALNYRLAAVPAKTLAVLAVRLAKAETEQAALIPAMERCRALEQHGRAVKQLTESVTTSDAAIVEVETALKAYNVCPECGADKRYWKV